MTLSFFTRAAGSATGAEVLQPLEVAQSLWGTGQLHGVAVSGALARAAERAVEEAGRSELRPARYTVDLFRPAHVEPCRVTTAVVRESARLCLVDAVLLQGDVAVARASTLFLKPTEPAPGEVWEPEESFGPPPLDLAPVGDDPRVPLFWSEGVGWAPSFGDHQNGGRKATWQTGVPVLDDEPISPFVAVASVADATSMVTNWGSEGVTHINTDITLTLARVPVSLEVGLAAVDRVSADGIAVGTAVVFDRAGRLGSAMVSSMANARRAVDFEENDFADDPRARRGA